jgi:predicted DNA binding CopG/RHH family protein
LRKNLEEVTEPVFKPEAMVSISLQPMEIEAVKKVAKSRGIDYTDLIREWILEKVYSI